MRTNIELDDELMAKAMKSSNGKTKRAVVEEALRLLVRLRDQESIRDLWGTVKWEGNLERSRLMEGHSLLHRIEISILLRSTWDCESFILRI